jgi:hypothetical protein
LECVLVIECILSPRPPFGGLPALPDTPLPAGVAVVDISRNTALGTSGAQCIEQWLVNCGDTLRELRMSRTLASGVGVPFFFENLELVKS